MGLLSVVGCFPQFVFQFDVEQVLAGFQNQFTNNLVFRTSACTAGFNNNNNKLLS